MAKKLDILIHLSFLYKKQLVSMQFSTAVDIDTIVHNCMSVEGNIL